MHRFFLCVLFINVFSTIPILISVVDDRIYHTRLFRYLGIIQTV